MADDRRAGGRVERLTVLPHMGGHRWSLTPEQEARLWQGQHHYDADPPAYSRSPAPNAYASRGIWVFRPEPIWPLCGGVRVTSPFRAPNRPGHGAVDITSLMGIGPVIAPLPGVVMRIGVSRLAGHYLDLKVFERNYPDGTRSEWVMTFAHLGEDDEATTKVQGRAKTNTHIVTWTAADYDRWSSAINRPIVWGGDAVYSSGSPYWVKKVSAGDRLLQGEVLGWMGDSGNASGAHLHWALTIRETNNGRRLFEGTFDPITSLKLQPG